MTDVMKKKILVAEDEKPMAQAMRLKLNHEGFDVDVADDGEMAVALFKEKTFDMVLLDIVMPKKDGFSVLKELREINTTTPILITSNLSQPEDREKALSLGAQGFLIKSDTPLVQLVAEVKRLTEK